MKGKKEKEVRCRVAEVRLKTEDGRTITGLAIPYGSTTDLGYFRERIRAAAFRESIEKNDQLALYNHDGGKLLGRTSSETLRLFDTEEGVRYELDIPKTATGDEVLELVRRGDLKGTSFGFFIDDEDWSPDWSEREVIRGELVEVSVVSQPAYTDTSVALRSLESARDEQRKARAEHMRKRLVIARATLHVAEGKEKA